MIQNQQKNTFNFRNNIPHLLIFTNTNMHTMTLPGSATTFGQVSSEELITWNTASSQINSTAFCKYLIFNLHEPRSNLMTMPLNPKCEASSKIIEGVHRIVWHERVTRQDHTWIRFASWLKWFLFTYNCTNTPWPHPQNLSFSYLIVCLSQALCILTCE